MDIDTKNSLFILITCSLFFISTVQSYGSTYNQVVCSPVTGYCLGFDDTSIILYGNTNSTLATFNLTNCDDGQMHKWQLSNKTWICFTSSMIDTNTAQIGNAGHGISIFSSRPNATQNLLKTIYNGTNMKIISNSTNWTFNSATWQNNTGSNLGTANGLGLYTSNSGSILQFRSITCGSNLSCSTNSTNLRINGTAPTDTDNFLISINNDATAIQILQGQALNISATTTAGTTIFKLGSNIAVLGNLPQIFTKPITFSSGSVLTLTPSSTTGTFNLGTLSAYPTSPRQGILVINGSNFSYNDNSNNTRTVDILNLPQTMFAKKTFTPSAVTAAINIGTTPAYQTSPRQGDFSIAGSLIKFNDNTNRTQTVDVINQTQRLEGKTIQAPEINGIGISRVDKSVSYTATKFDTIINVNVTACGSPCTVTLPSASTVTNETYWIKKVDFGRNILSITGGGSIDNSKFFNMTEAKDAVQLQSNGTGWNVLETTSTDFNGFHRKGTADNTWYGTQTAAATNATFTDVAGHLYATQLIFEKPVKLDQIRLGVTTAGASSLCRVGIYSDNGTRYPNTLVSGSDVGTMTTSALGIFTNTFAATKTLSGGLYWLAVNCQATAPVLAGVPIGSFDTVLGTGSTRMGGQQMRTGYDATLAFGALPISYPSGASFTLAGAEPKVEVRIIG